MAKNKTTETEVNVADYLAAIADEKRRKDCSAIVDLITQQTGLEPKMWGPSIVGFGIYHYKYDSGHEGSAPLVGFSSRVNAITLYLSSSFDKRDELLSKFGKYKSSKACIYIQRLEDVDIDILAKMIKNSFEYSKIRHAS